MHALATVSEPCSNRSISEGVGQGLLNSIQHRFLNKFETAGMFALASQGAVTFKAVAGRYKNFTFTVESVNQGMEIWISFYGRAFAIITSDNIVSPAPCLSNPEDTVRLWSEGTVDMIIEQLKQLARSNTDKVLVLA